MAQQGRNEETNCQAPLEGLIFCTNNCGYIASPATMNMCCECYRDFVLLQQPQAPNMVEVTGSPSVITELTVERISSAVIHVDVETVVPITPSLPCFESPVASGSGAGGSLGQCSSVRSNRCFRCKKRVGLTGFKCRCGAIFCALHRYSDVHNCTFDYKSAAREAIKKANPLVKASKIQKI